MKLSNKIYRFQEGGPMPAEDPAMAQGAPVEEAPAEVAPQGGEQDAMMQQIQQMAMEVIQQMGPDAAAMLAQAIMEALQGAVAPAEAPMPAPEEQPVYQRNGGKVHRIR